MRAEDSPFRPFWWGLGRDTWHTYGRYSFEELPPVPFPMTGDLAWLAAQPAPGEWGIGSSPAAELPALAAACAAGGITLPPAFVRFLGDPALQQRVRSCTACYVDVSEAPVRAPGADGYLVRFLADQQGCLFWYLYVTADGSDHAVLCSPEFYDPDESESEDAEGGPEALVFCGESFETFLCRFWLENELWFADHDKGPLPAVDADYIGRYQTILAGGHSVTG